VDDVPGAVASDGPVVSEEPPLSAGPFDELDWVPAPLVDGTSVPRLGTLLLGVPWELVAVVLPLRAGLAEPAGSALVPHDAVKRAAKTTGLSLVQLLSVRTASDTIAAIFLRELRFVRNE
jgi:hypothetical protein